MRTRGFDPALGRQGVGRGKVEGRFDGGRITSDGGLVRVRGVAEGVGPFRRLAACVVDHRDPLRITQAVAEMSGPRILGLVAGQRASTTTTRSATTPSCPC